MLRYYRKVIRISAECSPNVKLALAQRAVGITPTGDIILPGVLPWEDYVRRRATWDEERQCIGLDGRFYKGAGSKMFPVAWLDRAERVAAQMTDYFQQINNHPYSMGIDPAEGGDKTAIVVIGELGVLEVHSIATPDTSHILDMVVEIGRRTKIKTKNWIFDRGGGGKQLADILRRKGFTGVRTVSFGGSVDEGPRRTRPKYTARFESYEERSTYFNLRAQMYYELRLLIDPIHKQGFAIPAKFHELRRQLAPIPLQYDPDGRVKMPPKSKRSKGSTEKTLQDIIGCSPDEADALVLAVYGMIHTSGTVSAGAL